MEPRQSVGLIGSLLLFIGAFAPIVSVPLMGNQNYFQNGNGDGVVIVVLALLSLIGILSRQFRLMWWTGVASLGVLLFTFINFQLKLSELKDQLTAVGPSGGQVACRVSATRAFR